MKKLLLIVLLNSALLTFGQDTTKIRVSIDGFYQGLEPTSLGVGIGFEWKSKMTFSVKTIKHVNKKVYPVRIHQSVCFGRFITPDSINNIYTGRSDHLFNFKFLALGYGLQMFYMHDFLRFDASPDIGFGYKYIWLIYHRNIKIFDTKRMDFAKNNLTLRLYFPLFNYSR